MNRRRFLKSAAAIAVLPIEGSDLPTTSGERVVTGPPARPVRLGDPAWPSAASWDGLNHKVGWRLIKVRTPLAACQNGPDSATCSAVFKKRTRAPRSARRRSPLSSNSKGSPI